MLALIRVSAMGFLIAACALGCGDDEAMDAVDRIPEERRCTIACDAANVCRTFPGRYGDNYGDCLGQCERSSAEQREEVLRCLIDVSPCPLALSCPPWGS